MWEFVLGVIASLVSVVVGGALAQSKKDSNG